MAAQLELIDKDGRSWGPYETAQGAAEIARTMYPDQEQDEDRTGKGWDIQVVDRWRGRECRMESAGSEAEIKAS